MYKLKNSYIDSMIEQNISSKEVDFILYIALSQNEHGRVESVYYKDVCNAINISIQKFYDILTSLSKKGLIRYEKKNRADVCVDLLNNNFSSGNFDNGYLKVAGSDFRCAKFMKMKAGSKLLYLYSQRFVNGKHMLVKNFYEEFCKRFHVVEKTMQIYLHELKKNFFLIIKRKRNKATHYEMTMRPSTILHKSPAFEPTERDRYLKNIADLIRRNFKNYLPGKSSEKVLKDISMFAVTKKAALYKDYISLIVEAVSQSIIKQKEEGKKSPVLNAALVNSCLFVVTEKALLSGERFI